MKIAILILLISSLYFSSFALYGLNLWDEGVAPVGAVRVLNGEAPVQDFKAYAPGRYYVLAWLFKVFGTKISVFRFWMAAMTGLMVALTFQVLYWTSGWIGTVFGTLLVLSAPAVYYNRFYGFCTLLILFFMVRWIKSGFSLKSQRLLVFSFFAAYLFKSEVSVMGVITYILLVLVHPQLRRKSFIRKAEPVILYSVLVTLSYFIFHPHVSVSEFSYEYIVKIFTIFSSWSTEFPPLLYFAGKFDFWSWFENQLFYIPLFTYIVVILRTFKKGFKRERDCIFLCVAIMGCLTYTLVVWRAGLDNLIRCLPAFYILVSLLLDKGFGLKNRKAYLSVVFILVFGVLFLVDMNIKHGYYVGSIGVLGENYTNRLNLKRAGIFVDDQQYKWINEANFVFKKIGVRLTMLPLPFNPIWNFLLDMENPLPYDWVLPGEIDDENREWYLSQFRKKQPDSIIYIDIPIDGKDGRRLQKYAPILYKTINQNYLYSTDFGPFQLYLKRAS